MKYKFLLIFIGLLLISSSYALVITNPQPTITTFFNEPVLLSSVDAELKDSSSNTIYTELIDVSSDNKTVKHQPIEYLEEGSYVFAIIAEDIYGNLGDLQTQPFTLQVEPLEITLAQPYFAITPENPFDIIIYSSLPSDCRYALVPKNYGDMTSYLTTENNFDHTINNYNLNSVSTVYFACFSDYKDESATEDFTFSLDSSIPEITIAYAPDVAEFPIESELEVITDIETICAYSKTETNFENMNLMGNTSIYESTDYSKTSTHKLTESELEDFSINTFNIICKNIAGTESEIETIDIDVNTQSEAVVTINSPQQDSYQPAGSVLLSLTTNKLAKCHFSDDPDQITTSGGTFGTFVYEHEQTIQLSAGAHTYYFQCLVNSPEGMLDPISIQFTVDATAPIIDSVDDSSNAVGLGNLSEFTYSTDELEVKIKARDNESGIEFYNYSLWKDNSALFEQDSAIVNWTSIESSDTTFSITLENLNLTDGGRYYFKAKVRNTAGMESMTKSSNGITVNTDLEHLGSCYNLVKDSTETDIDCGGSLCSPCANLKSCISNPDCQSNYCDPLTKKCTTTTTCNDGILNNLETDIDCGGNCEKCMEGYACSTNSDCQSNYCDPYTKLCEGQTTCSNFLLNAGETDTDCGGVCPPCEDGKICLSDFDCQSAFCLDGFCLEESKCGNNQFNVGEQCDSSAKLSCEFFGLESGIISCNGECALDTSLCLGQEGICGDSEINPGEQCEGTNLNDLECSDFGSYKSGTLYCNNCIISLDQCSTSELFTSDAEKESSSIWPALILIIILLSLGALGYFLYSKKVFTFVKEFPYIKINPEINSLQDIFGSKPQEPQIKQQGSQGSKPQEPQIKQQIKKRPQQPKISLRRFIRERTRRSAFESFSKEDKKIKKLPEKRKPRGKK